MTPQPDGDRLLRPSQVARLLNVEPRTVTSWCRRGWLPVVRTFGGHARIPEWAVKRALIAHNEATGEEVHDG